MNYANDLHELCETLGKAVREANDKIKQSGGTLKGDDLSYIDKLTHSIKSIKTVLPMMEDEYSNDGMSYWRPTRSHDDGMSRRRYSRYSEYSNNNTLADQLRDLLPDSPDDKTRQDIKRLIDRLE